MPAPVALPAATSALEGGRWACILCAALLTGLGVLTGVRWLVVDPSHEAVIQQPIRPAHFPTERSDLTAPDPGDDT